MKQLISDLSGARVLQKKELQTLIGGGGHQMCETHLDCPAGQGCCPELGLCFADDYPRCDLI